MAMLPDFIIIGSMKAATSTLHMQLAQHAGIFMSNPKEPCFFSDDAQFARGMNWYESLFAASHPSDIRGESSTHYTKLPTYPRTIARMKQYLPAHIRFIYIIRHPIDRLISQYIHEWTQSVISAPIDVAIDRHPELIDYSRYAMQIEPYIQAFGCERVLPIFFERLSAHPQSELERVGGFIGYKSPLRWNESIKDNVSADRMRASRWRDVLINAPGMKQLRRSFVPQSLRDRIKRLWMMKRRPQLSKDTVKRVEAIFDEDLRQLGSMLGIPQLCCATYNSIARETPAAWHNRRTSPREVQAA